MSTAPPPTILHVEDNETKRYTVRRLLQRAGFTVREAITGQQAEQPALILLDVKLPDMNGFEICRQLKANPLTAPIPGVYHSAIYLQTEDKITGLESGAIGYLTELL